MTATEARVRFGELMRRAEDNETIIVERSGEPKVVIMSVDDFRRLTRNVKTGTDQLIVPEWKRKLNEASAMLSGDLAGQKIDWDQIIHDMREERSQQLFEAMGMTTQTPDAEAHGKEHE